MAGEDRFHPDGFHIALTYHGRELPFVEIESAPLGDGSTVVDAGVTDAFDRALAYDGHPSGRDKYVTTAAISLLKTLRDELDGVIQIMEGRA